MGEQITWRGDELVAEARRLAGLRIKAGGELLAERTRAALGQPGPPASSPGQYPRDEGGDFVRSVRAEYDATLGECAVGTDDPVGRYLELGTSRMAPRPWLRKAWQDFANEVKAMIESGGGGSK